MSQPGSPTALVRLCRAVLTLLLIAGLVVGLFALVSATIHDWGATPEERKMELPGDTLYTAPLVKWTHAITVDSPADRVWPWIAQMGDTRAGFYSFTFIENRVAGLMSGGEYTVVYRNADRIVSELQNPQPGDSLVQGQIHVLEVRLGEYLLGRSPDPSVMNWVWSWSVRPLGSTGPEADRCRVYVRFAIEVPGPPNAFLGFVMDVGGFVMERRMLRGLEARAEGRPDPEWHQGLEIAAWLLAFLAAAIGAVAAVAARRWRMALAVSLLAVSVLFLFTFVQPALWIRFVLDALLATGVVLSLRR